jgi:tetratricopeptide (TPR) repeat protein
MLTDLLEIATHASALDRGTVLLQLGRIARTLGDLDRAIDLLHAAGDLGRATGNRELVVREALGEAVVARTRGNYPEARRCFEMALEGSGDLGLGDVQGMAHQGLMIVCAEAGDFDTALAHGWRAVSSARAAGARVAEMLGNLAQLCARAGYDAAAMGGFSAALARASAPRVRLPILAGLATSAARLGDTTRVAEVERVIAAEANDAFPFETSSAWLAISSARRVLGDEPASAAAAERAAAIARLHGYYEISHRVDQAARIMPVPLADTGMGVIKSLETWAEDPHLELMISNAPTD